MRKAVNKEITPERGMACNRHREPSVSIQSDCPKESANHLLFRLRPFSVIPAQTGIQNRRDVLGLIPLIPGFRPFASFTFLWVSAFAGMTN
jgi:hypothetical protein